VRRREGNSRGWISSVRAPAGRPGQAVAKRWIGAAFEGLFHQSTLIRPPIHASTTAPAAHQGRPARTAGTSPNRHGDATMALRTTRARVARVGVWRERTHTRPRVGADRAAITYIPFALVALACDARPRASGTLA